MSTAPAENGNRGDRQERSHAKNQVHIIDSNYVNGFMKISVLYGHSLFHSTVSKRNYCTQKFRTARFLQHITQLLDISSAKYSSWQEMRAVVFRKACSNSIY